MTKIYITKIVTASLLGDGCLDIPKDGSINARYRQPKIMPNRDYIEWLGETIKDVCGIRYYTFQPKMPNAQEQIMLYTRVHPFFTSIYRRMYPNGHKVVDKHYLTLLDWESLAVWYQEDGTLHVVKQKAKHGNKEYACPLLCTDSFSYGDQHLLRIALKERLNLDFNVVSSRRKNGNQYYRLRLRSRDIAKFMDNISPYIQESFKYKLCRTVGSTSLKVDEDIVRPTE
jgi:hypothetical protein